MQSIVAVTAPGRIPLGPPSYCVNGCQGGRRKWSYGDMRLLLLLTLMQSTRCRGHGVVASLARSTSGHRYPFPQTMISRPIELLLPFEMHGAERELPRILERLSLCELSAD